MTKTNVIILTILAVLFLFPLYWSLSTALKPSPEILSYPPSLFPRTITYTQFDKLFSAGDGLFLTYVRNTVVLCVLTVGLVLFLSVTAGYALSKLPFRGSNWIFLLILSIIMVPFQSLLVPLFDLMNRLNLLDTIHGLVLIYSTFFTPFCLFLMRSYFSSLPSSLRESALIDGASDYRILRSIYLPVSLPALATVVVFVFMETWNDFILSLIFTSSKASSNVQVGIMNFASTRFTKDWGVINAGAFFTTIPTIVIFLLLQRYYVRGLTSGTTKE